jgi:hypothetical protein
MKTFYLALLLFPAFILIAAGQKPVSLPAPELTDAASQIPGLLTEFNAPDKSAAGKKYIWAGTWKYNSRYSPVTIKIKMLSATRFKFDLDAMTGANMGGTSGTARIKGNKAYFDDRLSTAKDADKFGCELLFIHRATSIELKETQECYKYNGAGVTFAREEFLRGNPPLLERSFVEREVFGSLVTDRKFKTLVGPKTYEHFLNDFQQFSEGDKNEDLRARVFTGCVRGICPWENAIIMFDDKDHFWAALVFLFGEPGQGEIRYYTNDPLWATKLPAPVESWRETVMGKIPVVYMNKPSKGGRGK